MMFADFHAKMAIDYKSKESDLLRVYEPDEGMPVAALYSKDNTWYRAEIIGMNPDTMEVLVVFVDFGTRASVPHTSIRYLKKNYQKIEVTVSLHLPGSRLFH
jgi:hypothetical protein